MISSAGLVAAPFDRGDRWRKPVAQPLAPISQREWQVCQIDRGGRRPRTVERRQADIDKAGLDPKPYRCVDRCPGLYRTMAERRKCDAHRGQRRSIGRNLFGDERAERIERVQCLVGACEQCWHTVELDQFHSLDERYDRGNAVDRWRLDRTGNRSAGTARIGRLRICVVQPGHTTTLRALKRQAMALFVTVAPLVRITVAGSAILSVIIAAAAGIAMAAPRIDRAPGVAPRIASRRVATAAMRIAPRPARAVTTAGTAARTAAARCRDSG